LIYCTVFTATPAIEVARDRAARKSAAFGTMSFQEYMKG
jgi:hypothetical protein